jgi:hypothetical protein
VVQTNRELLANRPVIGTENNVDTICLLIDVAVPSDRNVIKMKLKRN